MIGWASADDREQWFGGVVRARQYAQAMLKFNSKLVDEVEFY